MFFKEDDKEDGRKLTNFYHQATKKWDHVNHPNDILK
jgi:hypothetical protein